MLSTTCEFVQILTDIPGFVENSLVVNSFENEISWLKGALQDKHAS